MHDIAIIIPVYKVLSEDRFHQFKNLLQKITLNFQSDDSFLEKIIVVNDYPLDKIEEPVRELFKKNGLIDKLLILTNDTNRGQAYSRNRAVEYTKAEYLHFIDQDDFINPVFYENMLQSGKDFVLSNILLILEDGSREYRYLKKRLIRKFKNSDSIRQLRILLFSNISFSPGQYIIRRHVFEEIGKFPDLENKGADDYGLFFNMVIKGNIGFEFKPQAIFYYRIHPIQSKNNLDMTYSLKEFFKGVVVSRKPFFFRLVALFKTSGILEIFNTVLMRSLYFKSTPKF